MTLIDGSRHVALAEIDTAEDGGLTEAAAEEQRRPLSDELRELQELMYAAESNGVLVILQGMDAAGKDVTIQNVFATATAEAIRVEHFSEMTEDEAKHHFTWRTHRVAPERGELVIFDRSYYEQAVLPQLEDDPEEAQLQQAYEDILAFERILEHGDTILVKFFLHVSNEEQERRLLDRMNNEETAWKISARDFTSRRKWDRYMAGYEATMNATATPEAPWHLVPADHQWFHNLAVAEALVERLWPYRDAWIAARKQRGEKERESVREEAPEAFEK
jgi:PPK2 family polyphosphate:nucleotide phosphotransferase